MQARAWRLLNGWLLHRLTHPRYEHPKTYLVQVQRQPPHEQAIELRHGVIVEGERTRPCSKWSGSRVPPLRRPRALGAHPLPQERAHSLAARDPVRGAQETIAPHDRRRGLSHTAPDPHHRLARQAARSRRMARADRRGTRTWAMHVAPTPGAIEIARTHRETQRARKVMVHPLARRTCHQRTT